MLKPRVKSEVYNDLDSRIVNVFRVLRDPVMAAELQRRVAFTPFARAEFDATYDDPVNDLDAAHKTIVRSFMGHGSDSATRSVRTGFRAKCHDRALPSVEWGNWHEAIPAFTARLRGVVIESRDAIEVLQRYSTPESLAYVDPPYVFATRSAITGRTRGTQGYRHEMDDAQHVALAEALKSFAGMVVLSGYPSELYDRDLYSGWERFERRSVADGGKHRTEVVWLNKACSEALHAESGFLF